MRKKNGKKRIHTFYIRSKYVIDWIIALIALIVSLPLFLIISVAIKIEDGGKIIFTQPRTGIRGKIFKCYKFRSMNTTNVPFDPNNPVIDQNNCNITKVGRVIRKFKLDELPQLFNILRGEMGIIGPRPLLAHYFTYDRWELMKFEIRPGLTGYGQVMGNSKHPDSIRRYYDVYYVTHASFFLDVKIFFRTFGVLIKGEQKYYTAVPYENYIALRNDIIQNYEISKETIEALGKEQALNDEEDEAAIANEN